MNDSKMIHPSSLVYDKYGNEKGLPLIILEDFLLRNSKTSLSLESNYFREFCIYHVKYLRWENFPLNEKSLIEDMVEKLEEILFSLERKPLLISQGYSSALAMKIAQDHPEKIRSLHLFSPVIFLSNDIDQAENYKDFFLWWTSGEDPIKNFFALPSLADFFWKYLNLIDICSKQEYKVELNFWLGEKHSIKDSLHLQERFPGLEVLRMDKVSHREMIHDPKVQKIMAWNFKKYLNTVRNNQETGKKK
ncbi:MAG: alpha/beta hydrolase [Leptospiraceae bacterium]|nr:alpha/beta hydrolase [Leptospiraceae bacterium]